MRSHSIALLTLLLTLGGFGTVAFDAVAAEKKRTVHTENKCSISWTSQKAEASCASGTVTLYAPERVKGCKSDLKATVLSVVGSLVSVARSEGGMCAGAAHPYSFRLFEVYDLSNVKGKKAPKVSLYRYFDQAEVQRAIAADPYITKSKSDPDAECKYTLTGAEKSFAFHSLQGDQVWVRLGLSHGYEVCRGELTQIAVLLTPKSKELLAELKKAAADGRLMNQLAPNYK